jgi:hypothetical protein
VFLQAEMSVLDRWMAPDISSLLRVPMVSAGSYAPFRGT